ncbi:glycerate kinase [Dietzia sp. B32]|uniref:glycerate kinase n=1 Tax=Dietzia sp. B32 TaxID=2915130 RepID=UPI0021ADE81D|nr:glycerate kinase [Dietzia sp. B32]UVE94577.1 glycerate kinase [Dietzia sp. B32]
MYLPDRILVAPSGFKESLDAIEVADAIAAGVRRALPGVHVSTLPVPDGGEGTVSILAATTGGVTTETVVTGPVGLPVTATWVMLGGSGPRTAVIEMAAAAGLSLVPHDLRDPGETTTRGVGELIAAALDAGADRIVVGCGDSGTCDGGVGALAALGALILDDDDEVLPDGGRHLHRVARVDLSPVHPRLARVPVELACNATNVLCGPRGVARVFGPQKGATPHQVSHLERGLERWADVLRRDGVGAPGGLDLRTGAGTGASGGLGAGLAGGLGAVLRSRFDTLLTPDLLGADLDAEISAADLVITAEGAIDFQTPRGKVPAEVARRAGLAGVPVMAIAGSLGRGAPDVHDIGIGAVTSIMAVPMPLADAVAQGRRLLVEATERSMRMLQLGAAVSRRAGDRVA